MKRTLALLLFVVAPISVAAGEKDKKTEKENPGLAKQRSAIGTVLVRSGGDMSWTAPELYAPIAKESHVLALPGARGVFEAKGGTLWLTLAGNLPGLTSGHALESAVQIHEPAGGDLDFTLERGRVMVENRKDGTGKVRIRIEDKKINVNLLGKDSAIALELFSRWPAGTPFVKKPKADHQPVGEFFLLVLKGKVEVEMGEQKRTAEGPVLFRWTTLKEVEGPNPLNKTPDWLRPEADTSTKVSALHTAVEELRKQIAAKGVDKGLSSALASDKALVPEIAVYSVIAQEKIQPVWAVLNEGKSKEVRAAAANALRYWIDRGAKQDMGLYAALQANKLTAGQASIVMELLHGIGPEARNRPETYDILIQYLDSDVQAIRELAYRNLTFLVPAGRDIAFDAAAPAAERAKGQTAWRKLIPEGQVPAPK